MSDAVMHRRKTEHDYAYGQTITKTSHGVLKTVECDGREIGEMYFSADLIDSLKEDLEHARMTEEGAAL